MEAALRDKQEGEPVVTASWSVPFPSLHKKPTGEPPQGNRTDRRTYLTADEEKLLVLWAINVSNAGFPLTKDCILDSVQHIVKDTKRDTVFHNHRPGRKWYVRFLKRHPELVLKTSEELAVGHATVTLHNIASWFKEVGNQICKNNLEAILEDPSRIFSGGETGFYFHSKGCGVLAEKSIRNNYSKVNQEDEVLTVFIAGNAAGDFCPPFVCFECERFSQDVALSVPPHWGLGKSTHGWMTGEIFFEYITNVFHKWLLAKRIPLPVVLFIDVHSSHLTMHTSNFCSENGIVLVALLPNATHVLQPMHVAVFAPLKSGWEEVVHDWQVQRAMANADSVFKKKDFAKLLEATLEKCVTPDSIKSSFRKYGLYPWDPSALHPEQVFLHRTSQTQARSSQATSTVCEPSPMTGRRAVSTPLATLGGSDSSPSPLLSVVQEADVGEKRLNTIAKFEEFIGAAKIQEFEATRKDWHGDQTYDKLYQFWRFVVSPLHSEQ